MPHKNWQLRSLTRRQPLQHGIQGLEQRMDLRDADRTARKPIPIMGFVGTKGVKRHHRQARFVEQPLAHVVRGVQRAIAVMPTTQREFGREIDRALRLQRPNRQALFASALRPL